MMMMDDKNKNKNKNDDDDDDEDKKKKEEEEEEEGVFVDDDDDGWMERPLTDDRRYRHYVLESNRLECLLISDPNADKSSASMDVGVGQYSDERDLQGRAHFLEHLLFMGTTKYPDENSYNAFLNKNGGSSNAYTDLENTNYHFDVHPYSFESALDRFVQFFVSPLLKVDAVERELCAVDSEHGKNLQSDAWRFFQLTRHLVPATENDDDRHPHGRFGSGNRRSLLYGGAEEEEEEAEEEEAEEEVSTQQHPKEDQDNNMTTTTNTTTKTKTTKTKMTMEERYEVLRNRVKEFYDQYYSSHRMKLVLLGRESLDVLQSYVVKYCRDIPLHKQASHLTTTPSPSSPPPTTTTTTTTTTIFPTSNLPCPYPPSMLPLYVVVKPIRPQSTLQIQFPIDHETETRYYRTKPFHYLSHLLGHESKGSLLSLLRSRRYAHDLSAGIMRSTRSWSMFGLNIHLTDHDDDHDDNDRKSGNGVDNVDKIVQAVFAYLSMLRRGGGGGGRRRRRRLGDGDADGDGDGRRRRLPRWIHDETAQVANCSFQFLSKSDPIDYTSSLAAQLQLYGNNNANNNANNNQGDQLGHKKKDNDEDDDDKKDDDDGTTKPRHILSGPYKIYDYDPTIVEDILESKLVPTNVLVLLATHRKTTSTKKTTTKTKSKTKPKTKPKTTKDDDGGGGGGENGQDDEKEEEEDDDDDDDDETHWPLVEPWFGTRYDRMPVDPSWLESWNRAFHDDYHDDDHNDDDDWMDPPLELPERNDMIATNFDLVMPRPSSGTKNTKDGKDDMPEDQQGKGKEQQGKGKDETLLSLLKRLPKDEPTLLVDTTTTTTTTTTTNANATSSTARHDRDRDDEEEDDDDEDDDANAFLLPCRVWYKPENVFGMPKVYVRVLLRSAVSYESPSSTVMATMCEHWYQDHCTERFAYLANMAGLRGTVRAVRDGMEFRVRGYNHRVSRFLRRMVDATHELWDEPPGRSSSSSSNNKNKNRRRRRKEEADDDEDDDDDGKEEDHDVMFHRIREKVRLQLEQFAVQPTYMHAIFGIDRMTMERKWTPKQRLEALDAVRGRDQLKEFWRRLVSNGQLELLVHGNVAPHEAKEIAATFSRGLISPSSSSSSSEEEEAAEESKDRDAADAAAANKNDDDDNNNNDNDNKKKKKSTANTTTTTTTTIPLLPLSCFVCPHQRVVQLSSARAMASAFQKKKKTKTKKSKSSSTTTTTTDVDVDVDADADADTDTTTLYRFDEYNPNNTNSCTAVLYQIGPVLVAAAGGGGRGGGRGGGGGGGGEKTTTETESAAGMASTATEDHDDDEDDDDDDDDDPLRCHASLTLLQHLMKEPAFHVLRTEEQLGYIVHASVHATSDVLSLLILVQGDAHPAQHYDDRIEDFLHRFRSQTLMRLFSPTKKKKKANNKANDMANNNHIADDDDDVDDVEEEEEEDFFEANVNAVVRELLEKDQSMEDESLRYWSTITQYGGGSGSSAYRFRHDADLAERVRRLTPHDVLRFHDRYLARGSPHRNKLSVQVCSQVMPTTTAATTTTTTTTGEGEGVGEKEKGHDDDDDDKHECDDDDRDKKKQQQQQQQQDGLVLVVDDPESFKRRMSLFPLPDVVDVRDRLTERYFAGHFETAASETATETAADIKKMNDDDDDKTKSNNDDDVPK